MKVLICGDREWTNISMIRRELEKLPKNTLIIHGAARGADSIADKVARELGFKKPIKYPADWTKYGKGAGPIRNREMLKEDPDLVLAFHNSIENSKGTKDMIEISKERGIKVILFSKGNG